MENVEPTPNVDNSDTQSLLDTGADKVVETPADKVVETPAKNTDVTPSSFEDLLSSLPDELKAHASLSKFKSFEDITKSYIEQEKLVGRKTAIPGEDATAEEWATFYNASGRPEDSNAYGIEIPEALSGIANSQDRTNAALAAAHEAGLSKRQADVLFSKLFEMEVGDVNTQVEAAQAKLKVDQQTLYDEWGTGKDFEAQAAKVTAFEKKIGVFDEFEANGFNANPTILKAFAKLAGDLSNDSTIDSLHDSVPVDTNAVTILQNEMSAAIESGDKDAARAAQMKLRKIYQGD